MAVTVSYRKFQLLPVSITWFNRDPAYKQTHLKGLHILKQSVPILDMGRTTCIQHSTQTTSIIDLTQSEEQLSKALDPKSCRYEIRKIRKMVDAGQSVNITTADNIKSFLSLANRYIKEKGYTRPLKRWQLDLYLRHNSGDLLTIAYNGRMVGGNLYIKDYPERVRLLYSFNDRFSDKSIAKLCGAFMRYLHWYAMVEYYKKQGFRGYDMGGANLQNEATRGIAKFKLSFGGPTVKESNYIFISSPWIGKLYRNYHRLVAKKSTSR